MSDRVLIDTCGWIDYFRSGQGLIGNLVEQFIKLDQAVLCGAVITELLQGAKGTGELKKLDLLFSNITIVETDNSCWIDAGIMLQQLRSKGITLPLTDALIASVANKNNVPILTIDKHFQHLPVRIIDIKK